MLRTAVIALFAVPLSLHDALAANAVVSPPTCNESGFDAALATVDGSGGGTLTFNCGTATIAFSNYKQIAHAVTIDGGGAITLDGGNATPLFQCHASSAVILRRITVQHGVMGAAHPLENFGTLTLDRVRVLNNVSTDSAVVNYGTLVVQGSTFSGNLANGSGKDGGAINHSGDFLRVSASTFNGNGAQRNGGAIFSSAAMNVVNSTFNANIAGSGGGAIFQNGSGDSVVTHATIVGNSGTYGAGLYNEGSSSGTLTISRSIVSANTTGNCDGVLATGGYNLSNGTGCGGVFTGPGDLINQTLTMGALVSNGGPTQTMLPAAGNPAINHIPNAQCRIPADQRGGGRPFGAGCDSGAVEVGATLDLIFYDGFE